MKKIIFSCIMFLSIVSCGGLKTPAGEVDVYIPCQGMNLDQTKII